MKIPVNPWLIQTILSLAQYSCEINIFPGCGGCCEFRAINAILEYRQTDKQGDFTRKAGGVWQADYRDPVRAVDPGMVIGGWRWLEQRLIHREIMRREKQKREEESAQLDFLSALRIAV